MESSGFLHLQPNHITASNLVIRCRRWEITVTQGAEAISPEGFVMGKIGFLGNRVHMLGEGSRVGEERSGRGNSGSLRVEEGMDEMEVA